MLSSTSKRKLWACGMFVLPLVLVKVAGVVIGQEGPSGAAAATEPASSDSHPEVAAAAPKPVTQRMMQAADHVKALKSLPVESNPFLYAEAQPLQPDSVEPIASTNVAVFRVSVIMKARSGVVAVINGKPYRTGQIVGNAPNGWTVQSIDPDARSVTLLQESSGRTQIAHVDVKSRSTS